MYANLFPKFKVVEVNRSYAQTMGHVLAQFPAYAAGFTHTTDIIVSKDVAAYDTDGSAKTIKVVENGAIIGLNKDAQFVNYDATACDRPCLLMNDELPTSPMEGLDQYCEEFEIVMNGSKEETNKYDYLTYPRALPLYIGDAFTTNNYSGTLSSAKYAKVVDGVLTLQTAADTDTLFKAEASKLPAGQVACKFTYVGKVVAE